MRKWIVLLLVLLIVVAAWPVFVGGQVERNVTESQQARIGVLRRAEGCGAQHAD